MEQPPRRHRRDEQQPEIVGEEKGRQRGDDAAEGEKRQEREEQPRQADAQQVVAELRVVGKLPALPEGSLVERRADGRADAAKQDGARHVAALAPLRAIARRPDVRHQQVRKRWCHQMISSISCSPLPPVSLRKTDVS
jgi:hypothetical protein